MRRLLAVLTTLVVCFAGVRVSMAVEPVRATGPRVLSEPSSTPSSLDATTHGAFIDDWILVKLARPLGQRLADGSFALESGSRAIDSFIREHGIHRIDFALTSMDRGLRSPDAARRWGLDRIYRFHVPASANVLRLIEELAVLPGVDFAEPDHVVTEEGVPNDAMFSDQWQFEQSSDADMDGPQAWDLATGRDTVVAILDTGIDVAHEDLGGRIWTHGGEVAANSVDDDGNGFVDDVHGWDFVNGDADPVDDRGHGSRVASILGADSNNGIGIAGSCWNCRLMSVKVLDENGSGTFSTFADGVVYATDNGARVINYSAGSSSPSQIALAAVNYAYDAGVVLIGGAGNAAVTGDMSGVVYPKAYREFIASAGTTTLDERAFPFECTGSTSGSRYGKEVDVAAPASILPAATMGGGYTTVCGNSFSGPLMGGLVGLVRELNPSVGREEVRHLIRSGAEDEVGRPSEDVPGFDVYHGWGRANMHRTLQATQSSGSLRVDGGDSTRILLDASNPVADSYDFIRGDLQSLTESHAGVDLGSVVCVENDSIDADTAGNEDNAVPAPGAGFFYLSRFNAPAGAGSFGASSTNRDRIVAPAGPSESWSAEGDQAGARFGTAVSSAGDVNGDGYDDVIFGAELWDATVVDEGGAFVHHGSTAGLDQIPGWTATGGQGSSSFGWSVSTAGDVNGDGFDDVIVAAPLHDDGDEDEGRVYVYHGSSDGLSTAPNWTGEGGQAFAQFGFAVSHAGDVNNDGFDDVIVGSPLYDAPGGALDNDRGRAFVYHGSESGLGLAVAPDWTVPGRQDGEWFGRGVGAAGSVNCDEYDDVIVGAPGYQSGSVDEGRVYVFYGSATGLSEVPAAELEINVANAQLGYAVFSAGDVNGDGCGDVIAGAYNYDGGEQQEGSVYVWLGSTSGLSAVPDWTFEADERFANLGISVKTAGNVNGDCCDDIVVGADLLDAARTDEGQALVFHGSASGLPAEPDWAAAGGRPMAQAGWRVSGAGDVNGDGFQDVVVGARFYGEPETDEGRVVVYHGSPTGLVRPPASSGCPH